MSHSQTYPKAYKESRIAGTENDHYLRNEVIRKWEANPATRRNPQGSDFVYPTDDPTPIITDIEELFVSVRNETNDRFLSREMKAAHDEFITSIKGLYGVIDTLGEAHRKAANGLREITDYYGPRRGVPANDDIRNARGALIEAQNSLAEVTHTINQNAEKLRDMSNLPRSKFKVASSAVSNYYIGEGCTVTSAVMTLGASSGTLHKIVNAIPPGNSAVVAAGVSITGAVLVVTTAIRYFRPDAKAYKEVEWKKTQDAMATINAYICRLMDLLAGLDLFWNQMRKRQIHVNADDIRDLERIIGVLDQNVNQCRFLGNAIARSARLSVPQREISATMLRYERTPTLPPVPPEKDRPRSGSRQQPPVAYHSGHTYPPVPPRH
ncbi:hypothetical protein FRC17_007256 [Serendipita sp. 399]|nr:hypothetical protein FRC17_007256 [Serendipita sp. 399]